MFGPIKIPELGRGEGSTLN
ncbi:MULTISPECIES: twin-arginine translocase TatA/TatE family subunit [Peribacillus]|nr:twin-arginine translocase TatA/TatE family subunit [Peribacillus simplex]MEC1400771.1 twin-arginine translocase TatA/TatE family subunit [Peribacillus simplex]MED3912809.1 twin-arginine translocase TatA/TatE family subunit [Peribacillus simplex]